MDRNKRYNLKKHKLRSAYSGRNTPCLDKERQRQRWKWWRQGEPWQLWGHSRGPLSHFFFLSFFLFFLRAKPEVHARNSGIQTWATGWCKGMQGTAAAHHACIQVVGWAQPMCLRCPAPAIKEWGPGEVVGLCSVVVSTRRVSSCVSLWWEHWCSKYLFATLLSA